MDFELGKKLMKQVYKGRYRKSLSGLYSELSPAFTVYPLKENALTGDLGMFIKKNLAHGIVYGKDLDENLVEIGVILPLSPYDHFIECAIMFEPLSTKLNAYIERNPDITVELLCQAELMGRKILEANNVGIPDSIW